MKRYVLMFMISIIFADAIILAIPTDEQIKQSASILEVPYDDLRSFVNSYHTVNTSSDSIEINAETLCSEYLANELSANNKYKGKMILLTGKLVVVKNDSGGYYASLEGVSKNYIPYTIDVYFTNSALDRLANVMPGQTITVLTLCTGEKYFFSFRTKDATFVN